MCEVYLALVGLPRAPSGWRSGCCVLEAHIKRTRTCYARNQNRQVKNSRLA